MRQQAFRNAREEERCAVVPAGAGTRKEQSLAAAPATTRSSRATGTSARAAFRPCERKLCWPKRGAPRAPRLDEFSLRTRPRNGRHQLRRSAFRALKRFAPTIRAGARDPSGVLPAAYSSWLLCSIRHIPWSRDHPRRVSNAGPPHARPDLYARRLAFRSSLKAHAGVRVVQVDYLRGSVAMTASTAP